MYFDLDSSRAIVQERMEQAENDRLVQEAIQARRDANKGYNPALAWLGTRMQEVGTQLVKLSGERESHPASLN
jgi:hypothetical protein